MKAAIMQPYFFPYLGYYQLANTVDVFVVYDDVNYFKRGWINRNYFLSGNNKQRITLEIIGASQNKLINELEIGNNAEKLLRTIHHLYSKAPFYSNVSELLHRIFSLQDRNLASVLYESILQTFEYMTIQAEVILSSSLMIEPELKGEDRIINICKYLGVTNYFNLSGGMNLYSKSNFMRENIKLHFLKKQKIFYHQFNELFVDDLSIIDVLMFNSPTEVQRLLDKYDVL